MTMSGDETRETRVKRGRIQGYQPDEKRLAQIWDLARQGFSNEHTVTIVCRHGERTLTGSNLSTVLARAAGTPLLRDVELHAEQEEPRQEVLLKIGPGKWTTHLVEAENHTWALGRHAQLMEHLFLDRSPAARAFAYRPQVPSEGKREGWEKAQWEAPRHGFHPVKVLAVCCLAFQAVVGTILLTFFLGGAIYGIWHIDIFAQSGNLHKPPDIRITGTWYVVALAYIFGVIALMRWRSIALQSRVTEKRERNFDPLTLIGVLISAVSLFWAIVGKFIH